MSDGDDQDLQPYEQSSGKTRYTYFDRFNKILPPYIWEELIGISPQKRRAFLLQNQYLTPLSFAYSILSFFSRFAVSVCVIQFVKLFWEHFGHDDPITFFFILISFFGIYGLFRWSQSKNTVTIREEVIFRSVTDGLAFVFAIMVVFQLPQYWRGYF